MPKNPPAFQLYAADLLTATQEWTDEEFGIYVRLFVNSWITNDIPEDINRMSGLVFAGPDRLAELWPLIGQKFTKAPGKPGRLVNPRLEEVRKEQQEYRKKQSEKGKAGAAARWQNHNQEDSTGNVTGNAPAIDTGNDQGNGRDHGQKIALQSSSSPSSLPTEKEKTTGEKPPGHYENKMGKYLDKMVEIRCQLVDLVKEKKSDFNVDQFIQKHTNDNIHPEAIYKCLNSLLVKWDEIRKGPYAYTSSMIVILSKNYCEQEHIAEAAQFKHNYNTDPNVKKMLQYFAEKKKM